MLSGGDDSSTPAQLLLALFLSAFAHIVFFAALVSFSLWGPKHTIIVPGYKVDLVSLAPSRPASLLPPEPTPKPAEPEKPKQVEPEKPKPAEERPTPAPKVKSAPPPSKKAKTEPKAKEKAVEAPKKIVAKSEDHPKKEITKEEEEPEPHKTKLPPIETASIPPVQPSTVTPRSSRGGGGLVTEGLAFPHTWYLQILERKANENWITHGIIIAGKRADPVVRFNILRSGKVDGLELEKSSGNLALDESALAAITKASPFPQLPADYGSDHLTVHFSFTYEQRD
jgi:TonB family protein